VQLGLVVGSPVFAVLKSVAVAPGDIGAPPITP
jgi:hypothetical protein